LKGSLELTEADSHLRLCSAVTGAAVLSGGSALPPFSVAEPGVWRTKVPAGLQIDQLWVGGRFAIRARMPNEGFFYMQSPYEEERDGRTGKIVDLSKCAFVCGESEANALVKEAAERGIDNVYARIYQMWVMGIHRLSAFDPVRRVVRIVPDAERPVMNGWGLTTRYRLENLRVALDAPGEWYHDRQSSELLYIPRAGESPETTEAVVPVALKLLHVRGKDIGIRGVTFAYCGYDISNGEAGDQAQYKTPAAVEVEGAQSVEFAACSFRCLGPVGLRIGEGCHRVSVWDSLVEEFGVGGIHIGGWRRDGEVASGIVVSNNVIVGGIHIGGWRRDGEVASGIVVSNNVIRGGGRLLEGGVGVWIGFATDVEVSHNEICDLGYSGISSGWIWGYAQTPNARIRLNYNHVHDLGYSVLSDMGGIYTLGAHPDSEAIGNHIHDIWSSDLDGRGGWGLYADEGTSGMRFESNLVYRTKTGSFHHHFGRDNVVRNNIFAYAREFPIERTRIEGHRSFVCENNIVVWKNKTQAVRSRKPGDLKDTTRGLAFNRNVYFCPTGVGDTAFHGHAFSEWQQCGMDKDGIVADPLLEDPARGEWMPRLDSPAWRLGFGRFNPKEAGVRKNTSDPAWAGTKSLRYPTPPLAGQLPLTHRNAYSNDMEGYPEGGLPAAFKYQCPKGPSGKGNVKISSTEFPGRSHALEFADAADLPERGIPHVSGYFGTTCGVYVVSFSMMGEKGCEMDFCIRGEPPEFPLGILVRYCREDVSVNGENLVRVPAGSWWRVSISVDLEASVNPWRVCVEQDGQKIAEKNVPSKDPKFVIPGWIGWNSNAESEVRFWVDNFEVKTVRP